VFRIFQESLTNIARHARATKADVQLAAESDTLILKVVDNGIGIREEDVSGARSVGVIGMRERALRWGGRVEISGIPGKGTTVFLRMPIEQNGVEASL
jgi:two-component system sensor histidine kinase UhpB